MTARGYMLRSARGDWRTPPEILDRLRVMWPEGVDLDPCSHPESIVGARREVMLPEMNSGTWEWTEPREVRRDMAVFGDGLAEPWFGRTFVNPPFGELAAWAAKCASEVVNGAEIVLLLPARTDTTYWHLHVASANLVCFLRGRLCFVGAPGPCPFPTALAYWGSRPALFHAAFAPRGMVVAP